MLICLTYILHLIFNDTASTVESTYEMGIEIHIPFKLYIFGITISRIIKNTIMPALEIIALDFLPVD